MQITVTYGINNSVTLTVASGSTLEQVLRDPRFKNALGYGENVTATIDGVAQSPQTTLRDGDEVVVETKACQKA